MFQTDSVIDLAIGNGKDLFIYLLFRVGITETILIQHITGLLRQQKTKEFIWQSASVGYWYSAGEKINKEINLSRYLVFNISFKKLKFQDCISWKTEGSLCNSCFCRIRRFGVFNNMRFWFQPFCRSVFLSVFETSFSLQLLFVFGDDFPALVSLFTSVDFGSFSRGLSCVCEKDYFLANKSRRSIAWMNSCWL